MASAFDKTGKIYDPYIPNTEGVEMDQYVEKVIRMDEKIDRLIIDVREMKHDVSTRVSSLEKEKADRSDLDELKVLMRSALEKMASADGLRVLSLDLQKHAEDNSQSIKHGEVKVETLEADVSKLKEFKWKVAGALGILNLLFWAGITLWGGVFKHLSTTVPK